MRYSRPDSGFTLIELMLSVSIIGILAAVAIPAYQDYIIRAKVIEGIRLAIPVEEAISRYYDRWGQLPKDNAVAGLPSDKALRGAWLSSMSVQDGVIVLQYRDKSTLVEGANQVTLQPAVNGLAPTSPLLWVCGTHDVAEGFRASLPPELKTTLRNKYLPTSCRSK
jgi:type IV pilus assembly protein PilA